MSRKQNHRPHLWIGWHKKRQRWQVIVRLMGKRIYIGSTKDITDAVIMRNAWLGRFGGLGMAWRRRRQRKDKVLEFEQGVAEAEVFQEMASQEERELLGTLDELLQGEGG